MKRPIQPTLASERPIWCEGGSSYTSPRLKNVTSDIGGVIGATSRPTGQKDYLLGKLASNCCDLFYVAVEFDGFSHVYFELFLTVKSGFPRIKGWADAILVSCDLLINFVTCH